MFKANRDRERKFAIASGQLWICASNHGVRSCNYGVRNYNVHKGFEFQMFNLRKKCRRTGIKTNPHLQGIKGVVNKVPGSETRTRKRTRTNEDEHGNEDDQAEAEAKDNEAKEDEDHVDEDEEDKDEEEEDEDEDDAEAESLRELQQNDRFKPASAYVLHLGTRR